ncbi:MAG: hypothetical protein OWV35_13305 [Firmicutes bacterium]|nr:hypothetical protein [Bacillota bacterium]
MEWRITRQADALVAFPSLAQAFRVAQASGQWPERLRVAEDILDGARAQPPETRLATAATWDALLAQFQAHGVRVTVADLPWRPDLCALLLNPPERPAGTPDAWPPGDPGTWPDPFRTWARDPAGGWTRAAGDRWWAWRVETGQPGPYAILGLTVAEPQAAALPPVLTLAGPPGAALVRWDATRWYLAWVEGPALEAVTPRLATALAPLGATWTAQRVLTAAEGPRLLATWWPDVPAGTPPAPGPETAAPSITAASGVPVPSGEPDPPATEDAQSPQPTGVPLPATAASMPAAAGAPPPMPCVTSPAALAPEAPPAADPAAVPPTDPADRDGSPVPAPPAASPARWDRLKQAVAAQARRAEPVSARAAGGDAAPPDARRETAAREPLPTLVVALPDPAARDLAERLAGSYTIAATCTWLDQVPETVATVRPWGLVLFARLAGAERLDPVLARVRQAAPACRVVLLLGPVDAEARQWARVAARRGVYRLLGGETVEPAAIAASLRAEPTWADAARWWWEQGPDVAPATAPPVVPAASPTPAPAEPSRVAVRRATPHRLRQVPSGTPPRPASGEGPLPLAPGQIWWVWGADRGLGTTTFAVVLARWLAWAGTHPVRLLEGHAAHPGLARVIGNTPPPSRGWEVAWIHNTPGQAPAVELQVADRLTAWVFTLPLRMAVPQQELLLQRGARSAAVDAVVVVDAGLRPPTVPGAVPICLVAGAQPALPLPPDAWVAGRSVEPGPRRVRLPAEPPGAGGLPTGPWMAALAPLAAWLQQEAEARQA